ncbi:MAG: formylmethanofuran dehydrogenase subunit E family protein [Akkermansiaceae bacterium]|nr:formylmethanofuran dehydrogenase subunit E family protein [Akkermansiaceae bacterium]MCF7730038.1 formylmethanofuran dehydrogenase subunit E family protein [Akkermansiaceae bacterium]
MKPNRGNILIGVVVFAALAILHDRLGPQKISAGGAPCCAPFASAATLPPGTEPPKDGGGDENLVRPADDFFPEWANSAEFNQPVLVRDTQSALGRLSASPKEISLKDLARMHGHLCDGLVISFVELKAALLRLFPDGVVDRTDLRIVSKNGPCWMDAAAWLTGARINFQTLRVDSAVGDGFIVQKISTNEAWEVRLKPGVFPEALAALEKRIRDLRANGQPVDPADVDRFEAMANDLIRHLLNTPPDVLLVLAPRPGYRFQFNDLYGGRGDIINRDLR